MRVIVNGAQGNMGRMAVATLTEHPQFDVVAALGRTDDLATAIADTHAQIVVDLTRADCVYANSLTIIESGAHPVIGTSGLTSLQIETLKKRAHEKKLGGVIAPNFSIGAVLMMQFAAKAARFFPDVEIIEAHHPQKFDAPSGTAQKTASLIEAHRSHSSATEGDWPLARGERVYNIPIHAIRLPGVLARQEVVFGALGETLSITHNSIDRACFRQGIVLCCQKAPLLEELFYGLECLLED